MMQGLRILWVVLTALVTTDARGVLTPATAAARRKPWFCHDLDCPPYDLLNKTDAYEVRKYQPGTLH